MGGGGGTEGEVGSGLLLGFQLFLAAGRPANESGCSEYVWVGSQCRRWRKHYWARKQPARA